MTATCRYETTKAGDAVRALKASLRPQATARRDGVWLTLDAAALVPGDLVLLASGSHVPADCRVRYLTVTSLSSVVPGPGRARIEPPGETCIRIAGPSSCKQNVVVRSNAL